MERERPSAGAASASERQRLLNSLAPGPSLRLNRSTPLDYTERPFLVVAVMGFELKRVDVDFEWPLRQTWDGYINHLATQSIPCGHCRNNGYSSIANHLFDQWWGHVSFRPEDRGSEPFAIDHPSIRTLAERNVSHSPKFYGTGEEAIVREASRLATLFNGMWLHHLSQEDVRTLLAEGELRELTHDFIPGQGWVPKVPAVVPTAAEVNAWSSLSGRLGSMEGYILVVAECKRLGKSHICEACDGQGHTWPTAEAKAASDAWQRIEPPKGDGFQLWETVSEGSPVSPVFERVDELARWLESNPPSSTSRGHTFYDWMVFLQGPGWAPTFLVTPQGMTDGVGEISQD